MSQSKASRRARYQSSALIASQPRVEKPLPLSGIQKDPDERKRNRPGETAGRDNPCFVGLGIRFPGSVQAKPPKLHRSLHRRENEDSFRDGEWSNFGVQRKLETAIGVRWIAGSRLPLRAQPTLNWLPSPPQVKANTRCHLWGRREPERRVSEHTEGRNRVLIRAPRVEPIAKQVGSATRICGVFLSARGVFSANTMLQAFSAFDNIEITLFPGNLLGASEEKPKHLGLELDELHSERSPKRGEHRTTRIIRDTRIGHKVKVLYDYRCQICQVRINSHTGPYAEAAHIRALGEPHNGPDSMGNVHCLCPNHHVMLDRLAFSINDDLSILGRRGRLDIHSSHKIASKHISYHRRLYQTAREKNRRRPGR